ncbi:MAG: hypothetical protein JXP34_13145, partial [Planctomycetes bacterium]|nr:hypothetical protein [Planctomycetota bacterium]
YGPLRLEGVFARIPFDVGDAVPTADRRGGVVRFDALRAGPFALPGAQLAVGWDGRDVRFAGEIRGDLAGGMVAVSDMTVEHVLGARRLFRAAVQAEGIDLAALLGALGERPIRGEIAAALPAVEIRGGEISAEGEVLAHIFGGTARIRNLALHDAGTPYALFEVEEARLDDIRLLDLGRTFRLGVISGVGRAAIRNLAIAADEVYSFEADFETVPRPGVPQYVDKEAVESIGRILQGPLYRFERAFFSTFKYAGFGFACSLRNELFRLEGKYRSGKREYILWSSWYQIPRIDILNALPGLAYDWRTIYRNLRDARRGDVRPPVE